MNMRTENPVWFVIHFLNTKVLHLAHIHRQVVEVYGEGEDEGNMRKCQMITDGRTNMHDKEQSGCMNSSSGKFSSILNAVLTLHKVTITGF
jgi:hypothetical protein